MNENYTVDSILEEQHMEEVKMYDGIKANPSMQSIDTAKHKKAVKKTEKASEKKKPVMDKETRNYLLKTLAFMAFIGGCVYFDLIHRILHIPAEILSFGALCYKFGEWKGKSGLTRKGSDSRC